MGRRFPARRRVAACALGLSILASPAAGETSEVLVVLKEAPTPRTERTNAARDRQVDRLVNALLPHGVRWQSRLPASGALSARVDPEGQAALREHPDVLVVEPMKYGSGSEASANVRQVRADRVHRRDDLGQGVAVAVLDTGIQAKHPDFAGRVVAEHCVCSGCCPNGSSEQDGPGSAYTTHVHGLHVAGIVAGGGLAAPAGVAPRAGIVAVKVLDDTNRGSLVDWLRGLEWILEQRPDVQVVNMSLVSDELFEGTCDTADGFNVAFARVIGQLRARGVLVFAASGNTGDLERIGSPACIDAAMAVGAVDEFDGIADFTSRSPALDLLAPGVSILSAAPGGGTARMSGTSMASPHAAGTAALLRAWHPELDAAGLEDVLRRGGRPLLDPLTTRTTPRIDAVRAFSAMTPSSRPYAGGGSRQGDCLLEWATDATADAPATHPALSCEDGDPTCDVGSTPGECAFGMTVCFGVPDARLPRCAPALPIESVTLLRPAPGDPSPLERANADAIVAALPSFPLSTPGSCSLPFQVRVAAGTSGQVALRATAADGRADHDRLRLRCLRR